jgi:type I restriction enzyme S subunit
MNKSNDNKLVPKLQFPEFKNDHWTEVSISKLGETINGLTGKSGKDFGTGKPFVTYKQVFDSSKVDFSNCSLVEITENENQNTLSKGDILFTTSSETPLEVGFASVVLTEPTEPTYLNSFCFAFRPFSLEQLKPEFSQFLFHSPNYRKSIGILAQGITRFNISKRAFLKLKVSLPKKNNEQQKIAACLSSLDEVITAESQKLEVLKEHKKGLLQNVFPQAGEKVPKLRFKEFVDSGEWVEKKLGAVFSTFSGGTPNTSKKNFYGGKIPFIRSAEINKNSTELFLTEVGLNNSSAKMVEKGDLLIALYGANSGDVAISKINGAINQAILCLKSEFSNAFTYHYLFHKKNWIIARYLQGGQGNLSADIIKSIKLHFPSDREQQKIASSLSSLDDLIIVQNQRLEALKLHKKGLLQNLFPNLNESIL